MPARLRPTADIAADAILVGDPGRALALAQTLLVDPKMSNHARGLWGYTGTTHAGAPLSLQATGMGGPSAALVLADLAELGVRRAIRVGTASAIGDRASLGELIVVTRAHPWPAEPLTLVPHTGTSVKGSDGPAPGGVGVAGWPDEALTAGLVVALGDLARAAEVASLDALHPAGGPPLGEAVVADMQTAALFDAGRELGVALAAVLIVGETAAGGLDDGALLGAAERAGSSGGRGARVSSYG